MTYPVISADSHVVEPGNAYLDHVDRKWRDRAPRMVDDDEGVRFILDGLAPVRVDVASSAGIAPEKRSEKRPYADIPRGSWDPVARLEDQKTDGVAAEVIYPTIGMFLYGHPDPALKAACFAGYNRWIAAFCATAPDRFFGCGTSALRSPEEGIADLKAIKALGLKSVLMPSAPVGEDYDSPVWDPFWQTAVELDLPLSFHTIVTGGLDKKVRGSKMNQIYSTIHAMQELLGLFVLTGIFERHPKLRLVCVEADAGWLPHYAQRMDRFFREAKYFAETGVLSKKPSDYIFDNLYITFQDDEIAFRYADSMNWRRLMWANDFPQPDASWPNSQALLERQTPLITAEQRRAMLCGNVAELYGFDVGKLAAA